MPRTSRRTASKTRVEGSRRPDDDKDMILKAASLLIGSRRISHQATIDAARALKALVEGVDISQREGRLVRIEIVFTGRGKIKLGPFLRPTAAIAEDETDHDNGIAIAAAMKRGEQLAARILRGPEMLTGEHFAELVGMSRMAVHKKFKKHQILGLKGTKRGVRYPSWQLSADGRLVSGLSELLSKFGNDTWAAYRFLLQRHPGLGKMTAISALKAGKTGAVLQVADTVLSGDYS